MAPTRELKGYGHAIDMADGTAAEAGSHLRKEALAYCARVRVWVEKVIACHEDNPTVITGAQATIEGFAEDLGSYEELFSETTIPMTYNWSAATPVPQLYRGFWEAVENYDLHGTGDLVGPVLELERRATLARGQ